MGCGNCYIKKELYCKKSSKKVRYWNPSNFLYSSKDFTRTENTVVEELHEILNISVSERLTADVPVGVLLSGGIDSSLVTSLAKNNKNDIKTYSVGFKNKLFDESHYAKKISNHIKTNHKSFRVFRICEESGKSLHAQGTFLNPGDNLTKVAFL